MIVRVYDKNGDKKPVAEYVGNLSTAYEDFTLAIYAGGNKIVTWEVSNVTVFPESNNVYAYREWED